MSLTFTVPRPPVGVNAAYIRAGFHRRRGARGGKGMILSPAARDFKESCRAYALVAARKAGWPTPDKVRSVSLQIVTWNTRHDADAAIKLSQDALERIIYLTDRVVSSVLASKAKDDGAPRVEITVTLLEAA